MIADIVNLVCMGVSGNAASFVAANVSCAMPVWWLPNQFVQVPAGLTEKAAGHVSSCAKRSHEWQMEISLPRQHDGGHAQQCRLILTLVQTAYQRKLCVSDKPRQCGA